MERNEILAKIEEQKKTYVFRHAYAGVGGGGFKCGCCGDDTVSLEILYNKDPEKTDTLGLCYKCSMLWRNPDYKFTTIEITL
ncbi:MAG: hypothetical protein WC333_00215 [Dehalococcoidia bacterium]|jgi:hypothetical protein